MYAVPILSLPPPFIFTDFLVNFGVLWIFSSCDERQLIPFFIFIFFPCADGLSWLLYYYIRWCFHLRDKQTHSFWSPFSFVTLWRFLAYGSCFCSSFLGQLSCPLTSLAEELSPLCPVNTFPFVTLVSVWEMFVILVFGFLVTICCYLFRNMEMLMGLSEKSLCYFMIWLMGVQNCLLIVVVLFVCSAIVFS